MISESSTRPSKMLQWLVRGRARGSYMIATLKLFNFACLQSYLVTSRESIR